MAKSKLSLKQRLAKKKKELSERGGSGSVLFIKEGSIRVRVLPVGDENEFVQEVTQFYLGAEIKGVFSPSTFGDPCALMDAYNELKQGDDDEKELAKTLIPKTKYLMPVLVYADSKGKKVDDQKSGKLIQLTKGLYEEILDLYLDDDEWGDMTDPDDGFDLKITRTGSGMTDTEYSVKPCKNTQIPKKWNKEVDLEEMVKKTIPSFEDTQEKMESFLGIETTPLDDMKKKKKSKKSSKPSRKKKPTSKKSKKGSKKAKLDK